MLLHIREELSLSSDVYESLDENLVEVSSERIKEASRARSPIDFNHKPKAQPQKLVDTIQECKPATDGSNDSAQPTPPFQAHPGSQNASASSKKH